MSEIDGLSRMLNKMSSIEEARERLRNSDAAILVFRSDDANEQGWVVVGELDSVDVLLLRAAADDVYERYLGFVFGDDEGVGEEADEDERFEL